MCSRRPHNGKTVISRRRKNENVCGMSKNEKCTCKAWKSIVFHCQICKFVTFLLPLSSWLRKLPKIHKREESAVLFLDLVNFVKEEAELATDPIFSPECNAITGKSLVNLFVAFAKKNHTRIKSVCIRVLTSCDHSRQNQFVRRCWPPTLLFYSSNNSFSSKNPYLTRPQ